ncbi:MAG: PfkB family carbohydrate kinase [Kosmotogaceae bacterium]
MKKMSNSKIKVLVIGDVFLDRYVYYDPNLSNPSLETGLETLVGIKEKYSPGAASNVAKNLTMLGAEAFLVGPVGFDGRFHELKNALNEFGISEEFLVQSSQQITPIYTKFINTLTSEEDIPRFDMYPLGLDKKTTKEIIRNIENLINQVDAVIVEDQVEFDSKGCINDEVIETLSIIRKKFQNKLFVVDSRTKPEIFKQFLIKFNISEFTESLKRIGLLPHLDYSIPDQIIVQKYISNYSRVTHSPIIVTAGEDGSYCFKNDNLHRIFPLKGKIKDICGAGDAYTASLTLSLCEKPKNSLLSASIEATKTSFLCVAQKGTGNFSKDSLYHLDKPSVCEVKNNSIFRNTSRLPDKTRYIMFDFDGTISLLREGWQDIMKELMIKFITGGKHVGSETTSKLNNEISTFIDNTTGIQTILQMKGLQKIIKENGLIPPEEIKTAKEYKKIYTEHLKKIVKARMMKGDKTKYLLLASLELIKLLNRKGIKIFLASGTDIDDVIEESKYLGVHDYINEGIYGALDSYQKYSKKKVIEKLLKEKDLKSGEFVVIGDGPVEISVGKKAGAFTIGVASDEKKGFGWNMKKFEKLKRVGADLLIPDFSCKSSLIKLMLSHKQF